MIRTPSGRDLINPAHIIRAHVARNRAPEPVKPWQVSVKLTDGWFTWDSHSSEADALASLERLHALIYRSSQPA